MVNDVLAGSLTTISVGRLFLANTAAQAHGDGDQHKEEIGMHGVQYGEEAHRNLVSAYSLSRLRLPLAACTSLYSWTTLWKEVRIMLLG